MLWDKDVVLLEELVLLTLLEELVVTVVEVIAPDEVAVKRVLAYSPLPRTVRTYLDPTLMLCVGVLP